MEPECELGYTRAQIEEMFGDQVGQFDRWMRGQTIGLCEGRGYNFDTEEYEPVCGGAAHGPAYYRWDVARYKAGLPIID